MRIDGRPPATDEGPGGGRTARALHIGSPLGPLRIVAEGDALAALQLDEGPPSECLAPAAGTVADPLLAAAHRQLAEWFAGERTRFELALRPAGTPFQAAVWRALLEIPFGETRTYGEIAARVGRASASRAVGAANGRNPIAIVVPCHRVIGAGGALTGYAGGVERKRWLLDHERMVSTRRATARR
jgi:methylated-DNA-[protein]-cysteine S-methyltransferase